MPETEKISENIETKSMRISSGFANASKIKTFQHTDRFVKKLKNRMSKFIYEHLQELIDDNKKFIRKYSLFNSKIISAWETQTIFHDVVGFYENRIEQLRKKIDTSIQSGYKIKKYKRKTTLKNNVVAQKGSVKEFSIKKKYTETGKIVKLLTFLDMDNLEKYSDSKFYSAIQYFQKSKYWNRILKLAKAINSRLFSSVKLIEFETGTYRVNLKGDEFIFDDTNAEFKHWFRYKKTFYPLQINSDYHDLDKIKTGKNKQVNVKAVDKKINFIFSYDHESKFKEQLKVVGVDINIKHNFCTTSERQKFDYDRSYINEFIYEIKKLDAIGYQSISKEQKLKLKKLINKNEWYFKSLISQVIDSLEKQGITDIVLEDFNNNTFKSSLISNEEFKEKYTRLIRLLRLGNIKKWMFEQAEKRGIRVHTTPSPYTSQECPKCHNVDANNRKTQENFECTECGFKDEADFVSPINIKNRFLSNVLREKLHKIDNHGRLSPKKISREKLKECLSSFFISSANVSLN